MVVLRRDNIEIYRRLDLFADKSDEWPEPKKCHFYTFCTHPKAPLESYLNTLDIVQRRPDINWLQVEVDDLLKENIRDRLEKLLDLNDRKWTFTLQHFHYDDPQIEINVLRHTLAVLRNVQYLNLRFNYGDFTKHILNGLPQFKNLQSIHLGYHCSVVPSELVSLSRLPFAPQMAGIELNLTPIPWRSDPMKIFLSDRANEIDSDLRTAVVMQDYVHWVSLAAMKTDFTVTNCVQEVLLDCTHGKFMYQTLLEKFLEWLSCSRCSATTLELHMEQDQDDLPMVLDVIPRIPKLRVLRLQIVQGKLESILPIVSNNPLLEKIVWLGDDCHDDECQRILEFQLSSRPRLFSIKLITRDSLKQNDPQDSFEAQKIHYVSLVFETLHYFGRSIDQPSFPLSAWPMVLEKLGSACDCACSAVQSTGVDATFGVIQELCKPYRYGGLLHHRYKLQASFPL